jgi:hypothetical protein
MAVSTQFIDERIETADDQLARVEVAPAPNERRRWEGITRP